MNVHHNNRAPIVWFPDPSSVRRRRSCIPDTRMLAYTAKKQNRNVVTKSMLFHLNVVHKDASYCELVTNVVYDDVHVLVPWSFTVL